MDTVQIVLGLLLLPLVGGVAYYPVAAWIAAPAAGSRNAATSRLGTAIGHSAGFSARLFHDERAGERGPDQALDGSDRLRSHGSHAAGNGRVAAG